MKGFGTPAAVWLSRILALDSMIYAKPWGYTSSEKYQIDPNDYILAVTICEHELCSIRGGGRVARKDALQMVRPELTDAAKYQ